MILAKKSLGQNFLRSEKALKEIVEAGDIQANDVILEIGPGEGALTEKILEKKPKHLVLVEKDDRLIPILEEKFVRNVRKVSRESKYENKHETKSGGFQKNSVSLIHDDILELLKDAESNGTILKKNGLKKPYKVIANIPYYITGAVIRHIFELKDLPEKVVLLVQKEVAERMVAKDKKESILSLSVKLYGVPKKISTVPRGAFFPTPNVDSAVIAIENIKKDFSAKEEAAFFEIIKAAFAHKRKRLARNLDGIGANNGIGTNNKHKTNPGKTHTEWEKTLVNLGFNKDVRAEDLSVKDFFKLAQTF